MKVVNIGNIAEAYICDDLPAMGIVIEATLDELERLPNLTYKEVTISATPRRNCDVGTAEEQAKRMDAYCTRHRERIGGSWRCDNCPLCSIHKCELAWAQMAYDEEGGDK